MTSTRMDAGAHEHTVLLAKKNFSQSEQTSLFIDKIMQAIDDLKKAKFLVTEKRLAITSLILFIPAVVLLGIEIYMHLSQLTQLTHEQENKLLEDWQHTHAYPTPTNQTTCAGYFSLWGKSSIEEVSDKCTLVIKKDDPIYRGFQDCLKIIDQFCSLKNNYQFTLVRNLVLMLFSLAAVSLLGFLLGKLNKAQYQVLPDPQQKYHQDLTQSQLENVQQVCDTLNIALDETVTVEQLLKQLETHKIKQAKSLINAEATPPSYNALV